MLWYFPLLVGLLHTVGQPVLQHRVGLLPGNGQELALNDLKTSEGRSPPTLPKVPGTLLTPEELADASAAQSQLLISILSQKLQVSEAALVQKPRIGRRLARRLRPHAIKGNL